MLEQLYGVFFRLNFQKITKYRTFGTIVTLLKIF